MSTNAASKPKSKTPKLFKSKKVTLLKQNVAELQASLRDTTEQLKKAKGEIITLSKEIEDLQSTFESKKLENAKHIDDLMERMMEEQAARQKEKKAAEKKLKGLQQEHEERIAELEAEGNEKVEILREAMTKHFEEQRKLQEKHKAEILMVRDVAIADYEKDIAAYEKERRSVKRLAKLTQKALKTKVFGPSKKDKAKKEIRASKKVVVKGAIERTSAAMAIASLPEELMVLSPSEALAPCKVGEQAVIIEMDEDFESKEKEDTNEYDDNDDAEEGEADEDGEYEDGDDDDDEEEEEDDAPADAHATSASKATVETDSKMSSSEHPYAEEVEAGAVAASKAPVSEATPTDEGAEKNADPTVYLSARALEHPLLKLDAEGNPLTFGPCKDYKSGLEEIDNLRITRPATFSTVQKIFKWKQVPANVTAAPKELVKEAEEATAAATDETTDAKGETVEKSEAIADTPQEAAEESEEAAQEEEVAEEEEAAQVEEAAQEEEAEEAMGLPEHPLLKTQDGQPITFGPVVDYKTGLTEIDDLGIPRPAKYNTVDKTFKW